MLSLNPWISIWVHPRKTIQQIVGYNPNFRLWVLASIIGFSSLMSLEQFLSPGLKYNLKAIILFTLVVSPFWGYFTLSFFSYLIYRIGKFMGSRGSFSDVRAALAWANVPYLIVVICWIFLLVIFKADLFKNFPSTIVLSEWQVGAILVTSLVKVLMSIWALVIYIHTLAFIQKFTIKKTLLNIFLASAVIAIIIFLLWTIIVNTCGYFFDIPLIT